MTTPKTLPFLVLLVACNPGSPRPNDSHTSTGVNGSSQVPESGSTSETHDSSHSSGPGSTSNDSTTGSPTTDGSSTADSSTSSSTTSPDSTTSGVTTNDSTDTDDTDSTTSETDTDDPICECLDNFSVKGCKYTPPAPLDQCDVAADCCPEPMPEGYTCNLDYPYLYQCNENKCETRPCAENSECTVYSEMLPGYVSEGCQQTDVICSDVEYAGCVVYQPCQTASDCCPDSLPEGYTCGQDYPYLFSCMEGRCLSEQCSSDSQCDAQFAQFGQGNEDLVNLGCVEQEAPCTGEVSSSCVVRKACVVASDCCPEWLPAPYVCNQDYPYLHECNDGLCNVRTCDNDSECLVAFEEVYADLDFTFQGCTEL